jgi:putative ABC transport system permease protein
MNFLLVLKLAWRNLWRNKRRTLITSGSVFFAVILALLMESMNLGSHEQMIKNSLRFGTGYLQIQDTAYFETPSLDYSFYLEDSIQESLEIIFQNEGYAVPRIESFVLAAGERDTRGAIVIGIVPVLEDRMNGFKNFVKKGEVIDEKDEMVLIGSGLAARLSLDVGDTLVVIGQGFQGMQAAGKYAIKGLVEHPMEFLDNQLIYIPLNEASSLFAMEERQTHWIIMANSDKYAKSFQEKIKTHLTGSELTVLHWEELQPDLVKAIAFDSVSGKIMQFILYVVIAFGIFGTVLTMTLERQKEFAILVSIGMKRQILALQCFMETIMISFLGVLVGLMIGFPVLYYFHKNPIPLGEGLSDLMREYGMEPFLPFSISPSVFLFQGIIMLILSVIITTYPVWRSLTFPVLENLRR